MYGLGAKAMVCLAIARFRHSGQPGSREFASQLYDAASELWSEKAVVRKFEDLDRARYLDSGVSSRTGWLTPKGEAALAECEVDMTKPNLPLDFLKAINDERRRRNQAPLPDLRGVEIKAEPNGGGDAFDFRSVKTLDEVAVALGVSASASGTKQVSRTLPNLPMPDWQSVMDARGRDAVADFAASPPITPMAPAIPSGTTRDQLVELAQSVLEEPLRSSTRVMRTNEIIVNLQRVLGRDWQDWLQRARPAGRMMSEPEYRKALVKAVRESYADKVGVDHNAGRMSNLQLERVLELKFGADWPQLSGVEPSNGEPRKLGQHNMGTMPNMLEALQGAGLNSILAALAGVPGAHKIDRDVVASLAMQGIIVAFLKPEDGKTLEGDALIEAVNKLAFGGLGKRIAQLAYFMADEMKAARGEGSSELQPAQASASSVPSANVASWYAQASQPRRVPAVHVKGDGVPEVPQLVKVRARFGGVGDGSPSRPDTVP